MHFIKKGRLAFLLSTHEFADTDAASSFLELGVVNPALRFLILHSPLEGDVFVRDGFDPGVSEPCILLFFPPVPVVDRPRLDQFVTPSHVDVRMVGQDVVLLIVLIFSIMCEDFLIEGRRSVHTVEGVEVLSLNDRGECYGRNEPDGHQAAKHGLQRRGVYFVVFVAVG